LVSHFVYSSPSIGLFFAGRRLPWQARPEHEEVPTASGSLTEGAEDNRSAAAAQADQLCINHSTAAKRGNAHNGGQARKLIESPSPSLLAKTLD
jgi:hypothetical protein